MQIANFVVERTPRGQVTTRVPSRTTALRDGVGSLLALGLPASVERRASAGERKRL
jgi:hypothetical protein